MTEGVLILNWSYTHPSKLHVGIDESLFRHCGSTFTYAGWRFTSSRGFISVALAKRIERVSAVWFLSLSCASETLRLISWFVP
jgi:hypothetical protein